MRLKTQTLYQARWFIRGEERQQAGSDRDVMVVRAGREKHVSLPPEVREQLRQVREQLEGRQHHSFTYRGGDEVLLDDFKRQDHGKRVILKTIRYRDVDLHDRAALERRRRAFLQEVEVLGRGYYFLPEPVDLFTLTNTQDAFPPDAEDLRDTEPVLVYSYQYDTHLHYLPVRFENGFESFPFPRVSRLLDRLLACAAHLHRDGFLLQNASPEHVIVSGRDDVVRLVGVGGICRLLPSGRVDPAAPNLGRITRGYSDPVLHQAGDLTRLDWRHDMYAIAAIGYYLLTGIDLGEGDPAPDLRQLRGRGRVLERALNPDPDRRYGSLQEFRDALGSPQVAQAAPTAVFVDVENTTRCYREACSQPLDFYKLKRVLAARYPDEDLHWTFVAADFGSDNQRGFFQVLERLGQLIRIRPPARGYGMRQLDDVQLVRAVRAQVESVRNVVIISADGDFLAALEYARERGCRVRQLGFGRPAQAIQAANWIDERIDPASLGDIGLERR